MKRLLGFYLVASLLLFSGCAITHEYGPYMGKVVEKGTGEPIEGAVVFMQFYTSSGNIGGMSKEYVDTVETLTNSKGEYLIPPHRVTTFRTFAAWDKDAYAVIFKPGYGAFPGNRETTVSDHSWALHANKPVVVELPKLTTREERLVNHRHVGDYDLNKIPCEKQYLLINALNIEIEFLRLEHISLCEEYQNAK